MTTGIGFLLMDQWMLDSSSLERVKIIAITNLCVHE